MEIYRGNIVYSENRDKIAAHPNCYIAVESGIVNGIYDALPEKFAALPVTDFGERVIIPAFSDLHVHAPQYPQRGLGMDLLLADWLNTYTFRLAEHLHLPAGGKIRRHGLRPPGLRRVP